MNNYLFCSQVIGCTISLLWCLTIVGNQIDYVMKPWMMEDTEVKTNNISRKYVTSFRLYG